MTASDPLDLLIRGATIVDGTGAPGRRGDVGIRDDRIVSIGTIDSKAKRTIDADGLVVAPGFVDPHTHYDAQLSWDPLATPSSLHGVTSVIGGNCGFTIAPLAEGDGDYIRRLMARVEGMPLAALENGLTWDWRSFGDWLGRLDGTIAVNAGFLVGHCALRRTVMREASVGTLATPEQIAAMEALLDESLASGGLGLSSSQAFTHSDGDGNPVPSRAAGPEELLALAKVVGRHAGTTLEFITDGCLKKFTDVEIELMAQMSRDADRPLNWNVLSIDVTSRSRVEHQLSASRRAAATGGRIVALTMPTLVEMNMSLLTPCALHSLPGWGPVMKLAPTERMIKLADPEVRKALQEGSQSPDAGILRGLTRWGTYILGDVFSVENEPLRGRTVGEVAAERGIDDFDALIDIALADDLRTVLWPGSRGDDDASWATRAEFWGDEDVMLGGSDAGAHLDRMMGAPYTTQFLADCIRGRKLMTLEAAVHAMTDVPARLFGLRDRGRVSEGWFADLVIFDPERIDAQPSVTINDLPGGSARLFSDAVGIEQVIVNGQVIIESGTPTGARPGTVLRSGRDTDTVTASGPR